MKRRIHFGELRIIELLFPAWSLLDQAAFDKEDVFRSPGGSPSIQLLTLAFAFWSVDVLHSLSRSSCPALPVGFCGEIYHSSVIWVGFSPRLASLLQHLDCWFTRSTWNLKVPMLFFWRTVHLLLLSCCSQIGSVMVQTRWENCIIKNKFMMLWHMFSTRKEFMHFYFWQMWFSICWMCNACKLRYETSARELEPPSRCLHLFNSTCSRGVPLNLACIRLYIVTTLGVVLDYVIEALISTHKVAMLGSLFFCRCPPPAWRWTASQSNQHIHAMCFHVLDHLIDRWLLSFCHIL